MGAKITTAAPIVLMFFLIASALQGSWNTMRSSGFVLTLLSLVLLFVARLQLGRSFSIKPQAKRLVTGGLYSKIRHPVYVFGILALLGFILYLQQPSLLGVLALLIVFQFYRSRKEEQVLQEKFGDRYLEYKRQTWF